MKSAKNIIVMPENDWIVMDFNTGREYTHPSSESQAKKFRREMERENQMGIGK